MGIMCFLYLSGNDNMTQIATTPQSLGQILARNRKKQKLSQQNISKVTTIGQKSISFAEQGKSGVQIETIFNILAALDLEMVIQPRQGSESIEQDNESLSKSDVGKDEW